MGMVVILDAGHGYNTAGKRTPDDIREWTLNSKVAEKAEKLLSSYDCTVHRVDDVTGKTDVGLSARLRKAKSLNAGVYVSIHHNANTGVWNTATGIEAYTDINCLKRDTEFATLVSKKLSKNTGLRNRGVKKANFTVINTNEFVDILVEGGFMDGSKDSKYIRTEKGQDAYAKAIADSIVEYFGLKKIAKTPVKKPVKKEEPEKTEPITKTRYVEVIVDSLTVRKSASWGDYAKHSTVNKGEVFTVKAVLNVGSGKMYQLKSGLYITASEKYVKAYLK